MKIGGDSAGHFTSLSMSSILAHCRITTLLRLMNIITTKFLTMKSGQKLSGVIFSTPFL